MAERLLVYGGRNFGCPKLTRNAFERILADTERLVLWEALDALHEQRGVFMVVHGAAWGADTCGERWAKRANVRIDAYPALWDKDGRAAGPLRNQRMLIRGCPSLAVECPGGAGTADMRARLLKAQVPILGLDVAARKLRRIGR